MDFLLRLKETFTNHFASPTGYFFVGWIVTYALIGSGIYFLETRKLGQQNMTWIDGLKFCFPKNKLWSRSAKLDLILFIFNQVLLFFLFFFVFGNWEIKDVDIANQVVKNVGPSWKLRLPVSNGFTVDLIYTVLTLAFADLGWTIQHMLFHKIPRLWEFHKVHHSADHLTIFTIGRLHPVDGLTQGWLSVFTAGFFMGAVKVFLGYQPSLVLFMNVSVAMAIFRIYGIFRHSHIWISFGPIVSRFLGSPAMHQTHHGVDQKHWDKNFATVFSFWDWIFGTLYVPTQKEEVKYGIPPHPTRKYDTFWGCMLHPFLPDKPSKEDPNSGEP